jgi:hypothetical protein
MKTFKHSGAAGDLLYSLALVKKFGGGDFYLHLNQINWIGQYYYKVERPDPYHENKMNDKDYEFFKDFMEAQTYINSFNILDPKTDAITHNLDRFRPIFVNHPTNYVNIYCQAFGIMDQGTQDIISGDTWFSVPNPRPIAGKPMIINRTKRGYSPAEVDPRWHAWRESGGPEQSVFVGLPDEHEYFQQWVGCKLDYCPTPTLLDLAEVIAGGQEFVGNQSMALALAQGLGVPYTFERRKDLPLDRNESYFPNHPQGNVF